MQSSTTSDAFSAAIERLTAHGLHSKQSQERHSTLRRASIFILLANDGKILLTQRTLQLRSHPGEVCFPGGKQDEADHGDDWVTALRETKEEVGLDLSITDTLTDAKVHRLASLATIESINHLCVTPVVGFVNQSSEELSIRIQINPSEVELYFWAPLDFFLTTKPVQEYDIPWQGEIFVFRKYMFPLPSSSTPTSRDGASKELPITGLTAHVARQVAEIALETPTSLSTPVMERSKEHRGLLWRLQDHTTGAIVTTRNSQSTSIGKNWIRKYFILSGGMLHQYDNRQMAERKSQSASKKNRLKLLNDDSVHVQDVDTDDEAMSVSKAGDGDASSENYYPFRISVLDGRIVWHLAASSPQERSYWKRLVLESVNGGKS